MVHIMNQDLANKLNLHDLLSKPNKQINKNLEFGNLLLKHFSFFYVLPVMIKVRHIDDNVEYQLLIDVLLLVLYPLY
jgi:hypothetical protein